MSSLNPFEYAFCKIIKVVYKTRWWSNALPFNCLLIDYELFFFIICQTTIMAAEFDKGVVLGADCRTTAGFAIIFCIQ